MSKRTAGLAPCRSNNERLLAIAGAVSILDNLEMTGRPQMSSMALNLADLGIGMAGLTPARGKAFAEAAAVCLERAAHNTGVNCQITGFSPSVATIHWSAVDDQQRASNADTQEATEEGAAAIAILTVSTLTGLSVRERAAKSTGIDYWLGEENESDDDGLPFQNLTRLEVSGILAGNSNLVIARMTQKLAQTYPTDDICPAYVAVVEFGSPRIHVEAK